MQVDRQTCGTHGTVHDIGSLQVKGVRTVYCRFDGNVGEEWLVSMANKEPMRRKDQGLLFSLRHQHKIGARIIYAHPERRQE
ncbi:hypothetical protein NBRC116589_03540 [Ruegeria sp. HU-ET01832]